MQPVHQAASQDTAGAAEPDTTALSPPRSACPRAQMSPLRRADPAPGFDPSVPRPARVYAYWLGGKDHFPADREAAEEVIACRPQVVAGARANRAFLARVVRYLAAECGIRQFIDIGTGLPAPGSTHEVAQAIAPDCQIVYVDNDPLVLVHARALLTSTPPGGCGYVEADLRNTDAVLAGARGTLDLTQPAAVLLLAVLHFLSGDPAPIIAALARQLAPGSYLVISHLTGDFAPGPVTSGVAAYNALVPTPLTARSHAQVSALFGDLSLVAPGVVPLTEWRPDASPFPHAADLYAGVARIPGTEREYHPPWPERDHLGSAVASDRLAWR
jgi:SAM-dependent methyltransferase